MTHEIQIRELIRIHLSHGNRAFIAEKFSSLRIAKLIHKKGHAKFVEKVAIVPFGVMGISEESLAPSPAWRGFTSELPTAVTCRVPESCAPMCTV